MVYVHTRVVLVLYRYECHSDFLGGMHTVLWGKQIFYLKYSYLRQNMTFYKKIRRFLLGMKFLFKWVHFTNYIFFFWVDPIFKSYSEMFIFRWFSWNCFLFLNNISIVISQFCNKLPFLCLILLDYTTRGGGKGNLFSEYLLYIQENNFCHFW